MKKLLGMLGLGALAAAGIKKAKAHHESEWRGLTESEARAKLDAKMPSRVPADKRTEIFDKVIEKMSERGLIQADLPSGDELSPTAGTVDLREGIAETVETT